MELPVTKSRISATNSVAPHLLMTRLVPNYHFAGSDDNDNNDNDEIQVQFNMMAVIFLLRQRV